MEQPLPQCLSTNSVPSAFFPRVAIGCRLSLKIDRNLSPIWAGGGLIRGYMIWYGVNRRYGIWRIFIQICVRPPLASGVIHVEAIHFIQRRAIGSRPLIGQLNATRTWWRVFFPGHGAATWKRRRRRVRQALGDANYVTGNHWCACSFGQQWKPNAIYNTDVSAALLMGLCESSFFRGSSTVSSFLSSIPSTRLIPDVAINYRMAQNKRTPGSSFNQSINQFICRVTRMQLHNKAHTSRTTRPH